MLQTWFYNKNFDEQFIEICSRDMIEGKSILIKGMYDAICCQYINPNNLKPMSWKMSFQTLAIVSQVFIHQSDGALFYMVTNHWWLQVGNA